jgi:N-formylglutamate amidohydrolase
LNILAASDQPLPVPGADAELDALQQRPFVVHLPQARTLPFIFASPHSGRNYPASFLANSQLSPVTLRQSEDAFIDALFAFVVDLGAPLLAAQFPRAYVDVNRSVRELDSNMFSDRLAVPVDNPSANAALGLGVIPRIVRDGIEIYNRKLSPAEASRRIAQFYEPYHAALAGLIAETVARFGAAILIDCHSMPSGANLPDIVIGDRFGISAMPSLTHLAERAFTSQGFSVDRNTPYAGGYTTQLYGRRNGPVQALQIEINRALYLQESRVECLPSFMDTALRISNAVRALISANIPQFFSPQHFARAAE